MLYIVAYKKTLFFNITPFTTEEHLLEFISAYDYGESEFFLNGKTHDLTGTFEVIIYNTSRYPERNAQELSSVVNPTALAVKGADGIRAAFNKIGTEVTPAYIKGKYGNKVPAILKGIGLPQFTPSPKKLAVRKKTATESAVRSSRTTVLDKSFRKIFISHSSRDKDIVNTFCRLIFSVALNIDQSKHVFNTSLVGSSPKSGEDFRDQIKVHLKNADLVLQFISQNYKKSEVCLNEMGAAWVLNNTVVPMIIEEGKYDVGFINSTAQQVQLHDFQKIIGFVQDHKEILSDNPAEINWAVVVDNAKEFVDWLTDRSTPKTQEAEKVIVVEEVATPIVQESPPDWKKFCQIKRQHGTYYNERGVLREIPDDYTKYFLGFNPQQKMTFIEPSNENVEYGEPIHTILKDDVWFNSNDPRGSTTYWLIREGKRHHIATVHTLSILGKYGKLNPKSATAEEIMKLPQGNKFNLDQIKL